jgi:hypothetical protein
MKFLTVDPGESTGFSTWEDDDLLYAGQADLDEFVRAVARALGVRGRLRSGARPLDA